jgi:type IV pilus assembly protein PilC
LLSVGEETGNMEDMYQSVANYYQEEVNEAVSSMTSLLEPAMIVFMGLTVGFIIVAMYLPIFSMGDVIGG